MNTRILQPALLAIALVGCSDTATKNNLVDGDDTGVVDTGSGGTDAGVTVDSSSTADVRDGSHLGDGVRLCVDGEELQSEDQRVSICAEDLPNAIEFTIRSHDPDCPEQTTIGGAGGDVSLGFICDALSVRAHTFELGVPKPVEGFTDAVIAFNRYVEPTTAVSSGTEGPDAGNPKGSLTVYALEDVGNEDYRVVLEGELMSDPPVRFELDGSLRTEFCLLP